MHQAPQDEELLGDEPFLVLNAIYLCKSAVPAHITRVTGFDAARVQQILTAAYADDLAIDLGGQAMLTDHGRERVLAYYHERYAHARSSDLVPGWYSRFEPVNAQFINLVTQWQQSDGDERVQERLIRLVERQVLTLAELTPVIARYANYVDRFESGLTKIDAGQREFVCKPTVDSVHNVWFEFHEDILAVLGQPRET